MRFNVYLSPALPPIAIECEETDILLNTLGKFIPNLQFYVIYVCMNNSLTLLSVDQLQAKVSDVIPPHDPMAFISLMFAMPSLPLPPSLTIDTVTLLPQKHNELEEVLKYFDNFQPGSIVKLPQKNRTLSLFDLPADVFRSTKYIRDDAVVKTQPLSKKYVDYNANSIGNYILGEGPEKQQYLTDEKMMPSHDRFLANTVFRDKDPCRLFVRLEKANDPLGKSIEYSSTQLPTYQATFLKGDEKGLRPRLMKVDVSHKGKKETIIVFDIPTADNHTLNEDWFIPTGTKSAPYLSLLYDFYKSTETKDTPVFMNCVSSTGRAPSLGFVFLIMDLFSELVVPGNPAQTAYNLDDLFNFAKTKRYIGCSPAQLKTAIRIAYACHAYEASLPLDERKKKDALPFSLSSIQKELTDFLAKEDTCLVGCVDTDGGLSLPKITVSTPIRLKDIPGPKPTPEEEEALEEEDQESLSTNPKPTEYDSAEESDEEQFAFTSQLKMQMSSSNTPGIYHQKPKQAMFAQKDPAAAPDNFSRSFEMKDTSSPQSESPTP